MGIREAMNRHKSVTTAVAAVVLAGAGVYIATAADDAFGRPGPGQVYFTTDDGKTLFTAPVTRLAPFDHDGRPAVRAHVFECGGGRVVGYLSRHTEQALRAIETARAARAAGRPVPNGRELAQIGTSGQELKRPGDAKWVKQSDAAAATKVRRFRCPDGSTPTEAEAG